MKQADKGTLYNTNRAYSEVISREQMQMNLTLNDSLKKVDFKQCFESSFQKNYKNYKSISR